MKRSDPLQLLIQWKERLRNDVCTQEASNANVCPSSSSRSFCNCVIAQLQGLESELKASLNFNSLDFRLSDFCSFDRTLSCLPWGVLYCCRPYRLFPKLSRVFSQLFLDVFIISSVSSSATPRSSVLLSNVSVLLKSAIPSYVLPTSES